MLTFDRDDGGFGKERGVRECAAGIPLAYRATARVNALRRGAKRDGQTPTTARGYKGNRFEAIAFSGHIEGPLCANGVRTQ